MGAEPNSQIGQPPYDPLLSLEQAAHLMQVSIETAGQSCRDGFIPSLDRGRLSARGIANVPVIRLSTILRIQKLPAPSLVNNPEETHPAVQVVLRFQSALEHGDAHLVWELSSGASRVLAATEDDLLRQWSNVLDVPGVVAAGVATGVIAIEGTDAVCVRLIANPRPLTERIRTTTLVRMVHPLPLRLEPGGWRLDLPLFRRRLDWEPFVLGAPPAAPSTGPAGETPPG
jgi:hypothetical protein